MTNIIEHGVSEALQGEFEMLRETLSINGSHLDNKDVEFTKYSSKTIDKLAQNILCRNYGKSCLELAYLCWPIVRHQSYTKGLLHFFWLETVLSPSQFRSYFNGLAEYTLHLPSVSPSIALNDVGLVIGEPAQRFVISPSRVPLLSALLELLVSNVHGVLDDIETHLAKPEANCVSQLASLLQRKLYAFLKDHLPTANLQQKYRYIDTWLTTNWAGKKLGDEAVLNFWRSSFAEQGYVKFETTLLDVVDYQFAHEQVKVARELRYSQSDFDNIVPGSDESAWLQHSVFELGENNNTVPVWLVDAPKFLSKRSYHKVQLLYTLNQQVPQFPLSILRAAIFGQWQNEIIQQTRSKQVSDIGRPGLNYVAYFSAFTDWQKQTANTILACTSVLFELKDARCITILPLAVELVLEPNASDEFALMLRRLMQSGGHQVASNELVFADIRRWLLQSPTLNQYFSEAKKALGKNNRIGFKSASEYHSADTYEQGALAMMQGVKLIRSLAVSLDKYLQKASASDLQCSGVENQADQLAKTSSAATLDEIFASDLFIFKDELIKRHGARNE